MDGALERLYRRTRGLYLLIIACFPIVSAGILAVVVVYIAIARYLGRPMVEVTRVEWLAVAGIEFGVVMTLALVCRASMPAVRWVRGARTADNATAAWEAAVRLPARLRALAPVPVTIGVIPAAISVERLAEPAWYASAAIVLGIAIVVALGVTLNMVAAETMLRPVLSEIDAAYPRSGLDADVKTRSLRRRIVVSSLLVVYISAWAAMGLVAQTSDPGEQLALTIVGGVGVSITFGLILMLALSQSLFGPLEGIVRATHRVREGDLTTRVPLVSRDELGEVSRSFNEMIAGLAERAALHSALGTYIDPVVADRLLAEGEVLQGQGVDATIMFVDIVGYTRRSERLDPEDVVAELNEFFGVVIPIVQTHSGHANKLLGDGLMAVFGAPLALDDHADRAVAAAREIQRGLRARYGTKLRAGIGINSGHVVVGTTGGGTKLDFTVIGDTVNVAQRVEALTRETGDDILITEATRDAMTRRAQDLTSRGRTAIKGRETPVMVFAALARVPG